VRFNGCALQKDPLHVDPLRRNQCWIDLERAKAVYQYPIDEDGSVYQEIEFTYGLTLESKQTNFLLNPAAVYAAKLTAHRDGYDLFNVAGISKFETVSNKARAEKNNSVFTVYMILRLRAVITLTDIKTCDNFNSGNVSLYDDDKKVAEIEI
jgi:hypothetical protein